MLLGEDAVHEKGREGLEVEREGGRFSSDGFESPGEEDLEDGSGFSGKWGV